MCAYVVRSGACSKCNEDDEARDETRRDEEREPLLCSLSSLFVDRPVVGRSLVATCGAHGPRQQRGIIITPGVSLSLGRLSHQRRAPTRQHTGLRGVVGGRAVKRASRNAAASSKHDDALPVPLLRREEIYLSQEFPPAVLSLSLYEREIERSITRGLGNAVGGSGDPVP